MSTVEAFTGIRHGRGVAALMVALCCGAAWLTATATGASPALAIVSCAITAAMCALAAAYLSRVQIALNHRGVAYRAGLGRWHRLDWNAITSIEQTDLATSAVFGIGVPQNRSTARHVVGAGPAIRIHTRIGDDIWLSVPDRLTAARLQTYRPLSPQERP